MDENSTIFVNALIQGEDSSDIDVANESNEADFINTTGEWNADSVQSSDNSNAETNSNNSKNEAIETKLKKTQKRIRDASQAEAKAPSNGM